MNPFKIFSGGTTDDRPHVSPTARTSEDTMGLGRTSGQRSAEIIAGWHAEVDPSQTKIALSRFGGRAVGKILVRLSGDPTILNMIPVRSQGITAKAEQHIEAARHDDLLIVDLGAGFSARGLTLAKAYPKATIVEVDLPDVVAEKKKRLARIPDYEPQPNLEWIVADLGVKPLDEVLNHRKADVIISEGLLTYFDPQDIVRISSSVRQSLVPGGAFIFEIFWQHGMDELREQAGMALSRFLGQVDKLRGLVTDENDVHQWMAEAGYNPVVTQVLSEAAIEHDLSQPVPDTAFIVVASNPAL
jgi:O-methyltransferase involved in polyketide biosynthesis